MNREDFPLLKNNIVYLDNGATTLKPYILIDTLKDYYMNYSSNVHRGDYDIAIKAEEMFNNARKNVANFINADSNEIAFTNNTTDALNKIVFGYFKNILHENDEILLTKSEHASNLLPWFELAKEKKLVIKYIPLNKNYEIDIDSIKELINANTKVIKKEVLASAKNKTSIFDNEVVLDRMDDNIDKLKNFFSNENLIKSDRYEVDQIKKAGVDLKKFIKINRNNRTNKAFKSYAVGKFKGIGKDLRDGKLNGDNFKRTIGDKFNSIKKMYADCIGIYVTLLKTRKLFIKNK
jgi:hypothetical protein